LRARGIVVDEVIVYGTVEAPPESDGLLRRAWADGIDAIIFTSASTVRGFAQLAARVRIDDDLSSILIFAIGPVTADAVAARGWQVDTVAAQHSLDGIIQAIAERRTDLVTGQATS
jgi:uroporphyrinogen-III synthase